MGNRFLNDFKKYYSDGMQLALTLGFLGVLAWISYDTISNRNYAAQQTSQTTTQTQATRQSEGDLVNITSQPAESVNGRMR